MVLTVVVASVAQSFAWLLLASVSPRSSSNVPEDCTHPKRMMINNVIYCLVCNEYLYSGRCAKCGVPLDDLPHIGAVACGVKP